MSRLGRLCRRVHEEGVAATLRRAALRLLGDPDREPPLARANPAGLFATSTDAIHAQELEQIRTSSLMFEASRVEETYPEAFRWRDRVLRHAFLPATGTPRGLVVLFHGHNAFLHLGPVRPWADFDVLAPWDTFGWRRQGSWFWGERGDDFVARLLKDLIAERRRPGLPWFCLGSSMGGFGALWHGIGGGADGIYAMCPQVDLARKIDDFGGDDAGNPYAFLRGPAGGPPDLFALAEAEETLPPLFLVQNQFDHVNPFAEHAFRLLDIYNRKRAWYGARVLPSIGHGGDGRQDEAALFFSLVIDRGPPRRFEPGRAAP